jgi:hypothetical protein
MGTFFTIDQPSLADAFGIPNITNEDELNLEADDVDSLELGKREYEYLRRVKLNQIPPLDTNAGYITLQVLINLYNKVCNDSITGEHLTGLKIHYAVKVNAGSYLFTPLLQPVFLKLTSFNEDSLTNLYEIDRFGEIYDINGTPLNPVTLGDILRNDYKSKIELKRHIDLNRSFESHISNIDAEGVLFPFQLIFQLMKDNNNTHGVNLIHNMVKFIHNPLIAYKHSLIIRATNNGTGSGNFFNKTANRSHLCPPCGKFGFMVNVK